MEQIERIRLMESHLDAAVVAIEELSAALEKYIAVQPRMRALDEYLDSGEWRRDYDADEAGLLPADLKRGVLSEDGLFNVLDDSSQLNIHMLETVTTILKGDI
ncbi:MAG: DUF4298 domain-containing protein [Muribaculaceae bacterium]|nr:DUF4298 domain-containing protein [Muribaculaceae bacterium]